MSALLSHLCRYCSLDDLVESEGRFYGTFFTLYANVLCYILSEFIFAKVSYNMKDLCRKEN